MPKKYVKRPRVEKEEMERFTLYISAGAANKLRKIGLENDRPVAWLLREYAEYCCDKPAINQIIGIKI